MADLNQSDQELHDTPSLGGGSPSAIVGDVSNHSMQPPISTSSPEPSRNPGATKKTQNVAQAATLHSELLVSANSDRLSGLNCLPTAEQVEQERAELIEVYLKMKQGEETFGNTADELKGLVAVQLDQNKAIEDENSSQIRHLESINMMTKYQIVVTKLETTVYNIARTTEAKKRLRVRRAFNKLADNVVDEKIKLANKHKLVYLHFEHKLSAMLTAFQRYTKVKQLQGSFILWRNKATIEAQAAQHEHQGRQQLHDLNTLIETSKQDQESTKAQIATCQMQCEQTAVQLSQAEITLKELDNKSKQVQDKMKSDSQAKRSAAENRSKASTELKQKIKRLDASIKTLREENAAHLEKQSMTNNSIGDYISEMSTMLSSAELESALAMEHIDSDSEDLYEEREEDERQQLDEVEYEEDGGRPHAGTGGSSKLRARPQNQSYAGQVGIIGTSNHQAQAQTRQRRSTNQQSQQVYQQQAYSQSTRQQRQQR